VGVIAVLAGVLAVDTTQQPASDTTPLADDTTPSVPRPVAMMMVDPTCTFAAYDDATDAVIYLRMDVTDQQRRDLGDTVRSDRRVRAVRFESAQDAYTRFARLYAFAPDLVASVKVDQIPDAFLVDLAEPPAFAGFLARFGGTGGVDEIIGFKCPTGLRKGEGR
jgi:hypothetical protein